MAFDEGLVFSLAEFEEASGVFAAHGDGNFLAEFEGGGAGPVAVGEDVEVGEREAVDELQRAQELFLALAVEACHDVCGDAGVGHCLLDAQQFVAVEGSVVAAVHELQHMVAAGLQGDVKVGEESAARGDKVDDVVGEQVGFDAGYAVAHDAL